MGRCGKDAQQRRTINSQKYVNKMGDEKKKKVRRSMKTRKCYWNFGAYYVNIRGIK